ncbi:MAG TPA: hypothetical protein VGD08_03145 [Stellaceae bacterium]|jgi:hypothetical protein
MDGADVLRQQQHDESVIDHVAKSFGSSRPTRGAKRFAPENADAFYRQITKQWTGSIER